MSLSTRFQTSWELMKASLRVLRDQPLLLLFPVITFVCTIALALFFLAPILVIVFSTGWTANQDWNAVGEKFNRAFYVYGVVIYLVSMFMATFFNVAFYREILRALAGEPVSVGNGLRFAVRKLPSIVLWSLLAATVGLIIRAIEERLGWLGKIIMGLVGVAWSVAAVFAIPVIIRREDTNPLSVLRDSAMTLKQTWGEALIGFVGIRLAGGMLVGLTLISALIIAAAFLLLHSMWALAAGGVLWLGAILVGSFLTNMATHVYRCALYVYASEGVVPGGFTPEMMNAGWKVKKA
ncbi:MAG TPA: DUF6159 family protein [Opitutus sp.]|nr:DUF6159 family protein [Opitutus sp.]